MRSRYSRLERHKKKEANRQALIYLVLSVVFVGVMIRWGLPAMIGVISWMSGNKEVIATQEHLKPQRPVLAPLPEATFSATINVSGVASGEQKVKLRVNGLNTDEITTNEKGEFEFTSVKLSGGENEIEVRAYSEDEIESDPERAKVIYDAEDPKLTIISPEEEYKFFGMDQQRLELKGEISEEAEVTINDNFVRLDDDYKFVFMTQLVEGANDFTIRVTDRAGNTIERMFRVFYTK